MKAMERHIDWISFDFRLKYVLSNLLLKIIIYSVTVQWFVHFVTSSLKQVASGSGMPNKKQVEFMQKRVSENSSWCVPSPFGEVLQLFPRLGQRHARHQTHVQAWELQLRWDLLLQGLGLFPKQLLPPGQQASAPAATYQHLVFKPAA